jgi:hypothetical protein
MYNSISQTPTLLHFRIAALFLIDTLDKVNEAVLNAAW